MMKVADVTSTHASSLLAKFKQVRERTAAICTPLRVEDHVVQPIVDVSPPKWHLGHTTWFFEQFFLGPLEGYKLFHKDMAFMFNSYYETIGERVLRTDRGNMTRPDLKTVHAYRKYIDEHIEEYLNKNVLSEKQEYILTLGLQHEQQHQELLITDIKYILGHNPLFPVYGEFPEPAVKAAGQPIKIDEGLHQVGSKGEGFSFDNEHGRHQVYLNEFCISNQLVTNGEFMEFMVAGGYEQHRFWHAEGWQWLQDNKINAPEYWHKVAGKWHQYTLQHGLVPVDHDGILCHVSFYEAFAFAEWKGMRLPTEFEWEVASEQLNWGQSWEWTNSAYLPYSGYQRVGGALGEYNGKFMVNQMVLRGGSVATAPGHSRNTYRNFFHPHLRWQLTGIRLVEKQNN